MGRRVQQSSIRCRAGPPPGQTMAQRITPPASPPGSQVHPPPPVVKHGPSTVFEPCQAQCDSGGSGLHLAMPPRWSEHNWKLSGVDISAQITARTTVQLLALHSVQVCTTSLQNSPPSLPGQEWMRRRWLHYFSLNKAQCSGDACSTELLSASLRGVLPV